MPGFDAGEITDLFKFRLGKEAEWRWIPEPTDTEMQKFRDAVRGAQFAIVGTTEAEADADPDGFDGKLGALNYAKRRQLSEEVLEHVIEFCKGTPSAQEITAMPALTRLAFAGWLLGVVAPLL